MSAAMKASAAAVLGGSVLSLSGGTASADTQYNPPSGTWNGHTVYMSIACHDGNDGTPGGPCIPNIACGLNENTQSSFTVGASIYGGANGANLLQRGYKAIRGNGTVSQNISNSNNAGVNMHIPVHSNARSEPCSNTTKSQHGTWLLYSSGRSDQQTCSNIFVNRIGPDSPGTNDRTVVENGFGELNSVNAAGCYLEQEFHTWNSGVSWLQDEWLWTWRIGWSVDYYFGYP